MFGKAQYFIYPPDDREWVAITFLFFSRQEFRETKASTVSIFRRGWQRLPRVGINIHWRCRSIYNSGLIPFRYHMFISPFLQGAKGGRVVAFPPLPFSHHRKRSEAFFGLASTAGTRSLRKLCNGGGIWTRFLPVQVQQSEKPPSPKRIKKK